MTTELTTRPSSTPTVAIRRRSGVVMAAAPALIWLGARGASLLLWWLMAADRSAFTLDRWDGHWYLLVAEQGYGAPLTPDGVPSTGQAYAFFPGYPGLVRATAWLVGGHPLVAGVVVTGVAGIVFAYGLRRLAVQVTGSSRAALFLVLMAATAPMSVVYAMAYAETTLFALTVWALVAVLDRRWLLAGVLTCAAGLVRPTAGALIAVVVVAGLVAGWRERAWRPVVGALLAPLGLVGYWAAVAIATGDLDGYSRAQAAGWGTRIDGGISTAAWLWESLNGHEVFPVACVVVIVGAVVATVTGAVRLPTPVWAYGLISVVLAVASTGIMFSRPRMLLAAFVLLIPLAGWLARQRPGPAAATATALALFGTWMGAYGLTVWPYAI